MISTETAISGPYIANGVTTAFPFTFQVLETSQVAVLLRDADGNDTEVSVDDYTVALAGTAPAIGTATFLAAPASGYEVYLYLNLPFTQEIGFEDGSAWLAKPVNDANDSSSLRDNVLLRDGGRAIKVPLGETATPLPSASQRQGKYLAFDVNGAPVPSSGTGADSGLRGDLAAQSGSLLVGWLSAATNAVLQTLKAVIDLLALTPEAFGAVGNDAATDNATALNRWLGAAAAGYAVRLPKKTYYFKSALTCAAANDIEIGGRGTLTYNGASTTIDLLSIGTAAAANSIRLRLKGLRLTSSTVMTAGTALYCKQVYRSTIRDLILDGQDGNGNLWNGLWFDECDVEVLDGFQISAANDLIRCNDGSDFFLDNGKICPADSAIGTARNAACGIRMGGGFGGVQLGAVSVIGCNVNAIIDNTLSSAQNREFTIGSNAALDTSKVGPNLYLNETSGSPVYVSCSGWLASAATHNIEIANSASEYHVIIAGGRNYNAAGDGIRNFAASAVIWVNGVQIRNNGGYGVNNPTLANVATIGCRFSGNVSGDISGVVIDPIEPFVASIANGGSAAIVGQGGILSVTAADAGGQTGAYVTGGGGVALAAASGSIWVSPTTTPAAGKLSVAFSGGATRIYNNYGSAVRVQAVMIRSL